MAIRTLADVRTLISSLGDIAEEDLGRVVELATDAACEAEKLNAPCGTVELLGVRGSAFRKLNRFEEARNDLERALALCGCAQCQPRTRRRLAWLHVNLAMSGDGKAAAQQALSFQMTL